MLLCEKGLQILCTCSKCHKIGCINNSNVEFLQKMARFKSVNNHVGWNLTEKCAVNFDRGLNVLTFLFSVQQTVSNVTGHNLFTNFYFILFYC